MYQQRPAPGAFLSPLWIAVIYAIFGALWILFSDMALLAFIEDPKQVTQVQTIKGWMFIGLTATLVFFLVRRLVDDTQQAHTAALDEISALRKSYEDNTAHLSARENYIREVVNNSAEGIITLGETGLIETYNPAAADIFGYSREEAVGQSVSLLIPERSRAVHEVYMQAPQQFSKTILNKPRDLITVRKNGEEFPLRINISQMLVQGEHKYVAIMRDITERKALETDLRLAKHMAEKANRSKSEFLSSMSHELRTPLNAIIGFSDSMLSGVFGKIENDSHNEYLGHIKSSGEHLLELINEVLDLSKIEAGKLELRLEPTSPCEMISSCADMFQDQAQKHDISINIETKESPNIMVNADPRRLRQVLMNLISNGIKYNTQGGKLTIGCDMPSKEHLRINVTDTGTGISAKEMHDLFIPFHRLHAEHSGIPGTGIGLTLSKRLIEEMDGKIGVESIKGKGSTFWIELPKMAYYHTP